ncbi:MAG: hypothetical protein R2736_19535 [Solirubrobacterales bacterium]
MAALATGTPPTAASAGTYDVLSCDRAPVGGTDDAWTYVADNAASFTTERHCPSTGDQFSGLTLYDQLMVASCSATNTGTGRRVASDRTRWDDDQPAARTA